MSTQCGKEWHTVSGAGQGQHPQWWAPPIPSTLDTKRWGWQSLLQIHDAMRKTPGKLRAKKHTNPFRPSKSPSIRKLSQPQGRIRCGLDESSRGNISSLTVKNGFYPSKLLVTGRMGIGHVGVVRAQGAWEWSVHGACGNDPCTGHVGMVHAQGIWDWSVHRVCGNSPSIGHVGMVQA